MVENYAIPKGLGYTVTEKADFFYTNDNLIYSTNPVGLKWAFDVLIRMF